MEFPLGTAAGRRGALKLNRKQKTARNFLLAAAVLLLWWFLMGARPLTLRQAAAWEARKWGLAGKAEIRYMEDEYVLFASDGYLGLTKMERKLHGITCWTESLEREEEVTLLWRTRNAWSGAPELYLVTQREDAAAAQVRVRLRNDVSVGQDTQLRTFRWDEIYTAETLLERGAGHLTFLPRYEEAGNMEYLAEMQVFQNLHAALLGYSQQDFTAEVTVTFYDEAGNTAEIYEEVILDNYNI